MTTEVALAGATSVHLVVDEDTQIGAARRAAVTLGHSQGLGSDALGRLAIVVTEAATNMLRHARSGTIVLRVLAGATHGVEILALDRGPGIGDVARAMRDGYSSMGTAGQGLGGIRRLASEFEIYSQPGLGTALMARILERPRSRRQPHEETIDDRLGVVCIPFRGEPLSGDAWRVHASDDRWSVVVVDGLGHGPAAAAVAATAIAAFARQEFQTPPDAVAALDGALRGSRGAAVSVVTIHEVAGEARFAGVGNVDARVVNGARTEHFTPQNGIVGHTMPTLRQTSAPWPEHGRLIVHSDGLSGRWRPDAYPGLMTAHPTLIAGVLYRDFGRVRDDATVLVFAARRPMGD